MSKLKNTVKQAIQKLSTYIGLKTYWYAESPDNVDWGNEVVVMPDGMVVYDYDAHFKEYEVTKGNSSGYVLPLYKINIKDGIIVKITEPTLAIRSKSKRRIDIDIEQCIKRFTLLGNRESYINDLYELDWLSNLCSQLFETYDIVCSDDYISITYECIDDNVDDKFKKLIAPFIEEVFISGKGLYGKGEWV